MNINEIQACIPHRPPFLWLDEVVDISEKTIHARKRLEPDIPLFGGHYPQFPVLPGVIQCEMCFQAAAVLISKMISIGSGQVPVATRLNNTKFRRLVRPGETVDIKVELTDTVSNAFFLTGVVSVDGKTSTRCDFACAATEV